MHINRLWMISFLTLIWCGIRIDFSLINIVSGVILGSYFNFLLIKNVAAGSINLYRLLLLVLYVIYELFKSGFQLAWDILTPGTKSDPAILEIPIKCRNDVERTVLANIISLTPGTITINIKKDTNTLIIHAMFAKDSEKVVKFIQEKLEKKLMRVFSYE